jgi:2-dehydropantoate 2-reductase
MKICVYGPGAIGGHLAARLAKGGAEVSVIARGASLAAIRERGLMVRVADGDLHCRPRAAEHAEALGPQDAVVVTTKVPALPAVAAGIGPLLGPGTAVAFVVNGIPWWYFDRDPAPSGDPGDGRRVPEADPGDAVRAAVGVERTLGGVIYSASHLVAPGIVAVTSGTSKLFLGEPDGARSDRAVALAAAFKAGGMPCSVSTDIRTDVWAKLLNNLAVGPACLLTRQPMRATFADPAIRAASLSAVREGIAIAAAYGRMVPGDPADRLDLSAGLAHKPSILQDLEAGRAMEIDSLLRAPLRLAREAGVAAPMLELLVTLAVQSAVAAGLYRPD